MKIKMLMAFVALLLFSAFTADHTITIFMIGDSTMANKSLEGGNQDVDGAMCWEDISVKIFVWKPC